MMISKKEWKRDEKRFYCPKEEPSEILMPAYQYFSLSGTGNPNSDHFRQYVEALYTASYAVRMSHKGNRPIEGFYEYTVYPLEGVWDLTPEGKALYEVQAESDRFGIQHLKDYLSFELMIRQPEFLTEDWARETLEILAKKKSMPLLKHITLLKQEPSKCVQIMHHGAYDNEPLSFEKMSAFCEAHDLKRISEKHREIYLTDNRKTPVEKLRTILRVEVF